MRNPSADSAGPLLEASIEKEPHAQFAAFAGLAEAEPQTSAQDSDVFAMPATQGQVRFWSLDQLNPGNPALNMPLMWQCTGFLDVPALEEAFAQCVQRHESLRTTFQRVEGTLSQVIHPRMAMPIPLVDLTGLAGEAQRTHADRLTREHAAFRFDLKRGPLLVLKLLKLGAQHHLLLVTMHHIICDGISNGILMRDMVAWYKALVDDTVPQLPELPIQFADYAVWHEQWRAGDEPAASLDFWRRTLGTGFTPLHLQHDADAPAALPPGHEELTGDIETLLIPPDLAVRAHAFCTRDNVTLNMLLFSVFCALLSRLTGQQDLTIGSPCANRTEDTQDLIGLFMNIQVLRVRLSEHSSFRDLLRQVQTWTLGASENQLLPFEDLVYDPFFSQAGSSFEIPIFFLYQKSFMLTGRIPSRAGELEIVPLRSESPGAVFEVMFAIVDREEEGPRLQLEYNPQFFKASTIQRFLRLFLDLLESALAAPEARVGDLKLPSANVLAPSTAPAPIAAAHEQTSASAPVASSSESEPIVLPRDLVEQQIAELWQSTLGIPRISVHASFFSLGAGSLAALRLITRINRAYAMDLGLASLISASSIASLAELVRSRFSPNTASPIVPIQPRGSRTPLFIVHGVGGNVVNFYGLSMRMGLDQPVYGVQSQALLSGQPALLRLQDMAAYYLAEIRKLQPRGPYQLLGYSFGGTVVLEMARQLRAAGETVALLGMLDAKTLEYEQQLAQTRSVQARLERRVKRFHGNTVRLTLSQRTAYLLDKVKTRTIRYLCMAAAALRFRRVPAFLKSAYDINFVAIRNHRLRPYDGKLVLFRAQEQEFAEGPYDLGWGKIFGGGVEVHDLPGDHDRIFLEPNIDALATSLRSVLQNA